MISFYVLLPSNHESYHLYTANKLQVKQHTVSSYGCPALFKNAVNRNTPVLWLYVGQSGQRSRCWEGGTFSVYYIYSSKPAPTTQPHTDPRHQRTVLGGNCDCGPACIRPKNGASIHNTPGAAPSGRAGCPIQSGQETGRQK